MNKNRIRLNESQLRQVIKESVKNILMENNDGRLGYSDNTVNRIANIKEIMGSDNLVDAIAGYLGEYKINEILDFIEQTYGVCNVDDDEY